MTILPSSEVSHNFRYLLYRVRHLLHKPYVASEVSWADGGITIDQVLRHFSVAIQGSHVQGCLQLHVSCVQLSTQLDQPLRDLRSVFQAGIV